MTMRRFLLLLSAGLFAIIGAMYLSSLRHLDRDPRGGHLLPGLEADLDSLTDIRLRKGAAAATLNLHRSAPGHWAVTERGDYPADLAKIRRLLLQLSEAKIVEEKTANPANYAILGVEDPSDPGAGGIEVSLISPRGGRALIIGKPAGGGTYARRAGEATSVAVEPPISVEPGARDWIETTLLNIAVDKIQSIHVAFADGSSYAITRRRVADSTQGATAGEFSLDAVPRGREANDAATLAPSPSSFDGFSADDVAPAAGVDFTKSAVCEIAMIDGSGYTVSGTVVADKHWIKVNATRDDALNARTRQRAFEVAAYRYDALFRPIDQLLKPLPARKP